MDCKELMVGNWVTFTEQWKKSYLITYGTIFEIYEHKVIVKCGDKLCALPIDAIRPIPLTKEILKANGLLGYVLHNINQTTNCEPIIFERGMVIFEYKYNGNFGMRFVFHHVHELQHALRICGLTELADNFKVEGGGK